MSRLSTKTKSFNPFSTYLQWRLKSLPTWRWKMHLQGRLHRKKWRREKQKSTQVTRKCSKNKEPKTHVWMTGKTGIPKAKETQSVYDLIKLNVRETICFRWACKHWVHSQLHVAYNAASVEAQRLAEISSTDTINIRPRLCTGVKVR